MPLLTATFAWGYGNVGYGPSRLRAILSNNNPDHIERTLTEAVEALSSEGTEAAYSVLRPWRANVVWGFGPAFLSKFLYFVIWKMDVPGPSSKMKVTARV